jgi:hypothetical protein
LQQDLGTCKALNAAVDLGEARDLLSMRDYELKQHPEKAA